MLPSRLEQPARLHLEATWPLREAVAAAGQAYMRHCDIFLPLSTGRTVAGEGMKWQGNGAWQGMTWRDAASPSPL